MPKGFVKTPHKIKCAECSIEIVRDTTRREYCSTCRKNRDNERVRLCRKDGYEKGKFKEYSKKWRKTPKGKMCASRANSRRRARLKNLKSKNDLTANQWEQILCGFTYHCAYCLKPSNELDIDHFIPVSKGGGLTFENIVPACKSCNSRKYNKIVGLGSYYNGG